MKKLLVVTGPQGSGNHMWSKVLSGTPGVRGWEQLQNEYWVGHGNEPFALIWQDPKLFHEIDWEPGNYVTSISCPTVPVGGPTAPSVEPPYGDFMANAKQAGFDVKLAIIGRDKNILEFQQNRLRENHSTPRFLKHIEVLMSYDPVFISTELLYLYQDHYLRQLSKLLDFPINNTNLPEILKDNTNLKYLHPVESYWLDEHCRTNSRKNGDPTNPYVYQPKKNSGGETNT
jgi:hypothetical protein